MVKVRVRVKIRLRVYGKRDYMKRDVTFHSTVFLMS